MSTNDVTAPGRSALWTEAALRALTGAAVSSESTVEESVRDAIAVADLFEAACLKQHAEEQEAARVAAAAQLAADTQTVLRTRRYRVMWAEVQYVLTVERVEYKTVYFLPLAGVANGGQISAPLSDVVTGTGFEPVGPEEQE